MVIFDVEKDSIDKLIHFFESSDNTNLFNYKLKLKNTWYQHHATDKSQNYATNEEKNYVFTHDPFLNQTQYNALLVFLTNITDNQRRNDPNYREEIQIKENTGAIK